VFFRKKKNIKLSIQDGENSWQLKKHHLEKDATKDDYSHIFSYYRAAMKEGLSGSVLCKILEYGMQPTPINSSPDLENTTKLHTSLGPIFLA
jgi:hypothetical protein